MLSVKSSFYLFGGKSDFGYTGPVYWNKFCMFKHISKIGRLDLSTKKWVEAGVLNQGRARHAVAFIDISFIVVGSYNNGKAQTEKCSLVRVFLWHRESYYF